MEAKRGNLLGSPGPTRKQKRLKTESEKSFLMSYETDLKQIKALAAEKEDENWKFRGFLKSCVPGEKIDSLFHKFAEEVSKEIDCTKCANCCRHVSPYLSAADIDRLAGHLNLSDNALREKYLVKSDEGDEFYLNTLPCPFLEGNLCTVYASRPDACRSYPHLHKRDRVFSLISIISNYQVCPIVYHVFERVKMELATQEQDDIFMDFDDESDD